ncbi:D-3-phosphoglycerate dehydrogenase [Bacillus pakistanensis]|uniref:D-3-phosphoglycerate dehydrogenase n=1 Tax=Rossellomorea pakistanensis TaxID=992288 RepID=A0ABS2NDP4_9BACI|nr:phosphoglycerate dehydrogenase [Bacillus pakistanensis]MBM7585966.1 D-3-phosphoglycerate dehydrogenase [Bacillus pakistanensis]
MYSIQAFNAIADAGLKLIEEDLDFVLNSETQEPDGYIARSFNFHNYAIGEQVKGIARAGAGVNNIPVEHCTERGIVVFNTPGANANAVKELVLTCIMASSRNLFDAVKWTAEIEDRGKEIPELVEKGKKQFVGTEIKGKRLGVIGVGAIGVLVANDALELGMEVVAFDPFISVETAWRLSQNVRRAITLEEIFSTCDYITMHVPLNDKTKGLLNENAFKQMKDGIRILNFSRGELVDEQALKLAIEEGIVENYITDFPNENILGTNKVIGVPHLGASTKESEENCAVMAARQLKHYLKTGNIKHSVNLPDVEIPFSGKRRLAVMHKNIPGMVGRMTGILAKFEMNIADMINRSKDAWAYTIIDIDNEIDETTEQNIKNSVNEIQGTVSVRLL